MAEMLLTFLCALVYSSAGIQTAQAQETTAVCRKGFEWMTNSMEQSPCLVSAWLWTPCYGLGNDSFVESIRPGWSYDGPQGKSQFESTPCDCNTVFYSTFAACGICQGGSIDPWPTYQTNCSKVYNASYPEPIPEGTAIPAWAFLDVTRNSTFNVNAAEALAAQDPPDITAGSSPSGSLLASTTTIVSALSSSITVASTTAFASGSPAVGGSASGANSIGKHGSDIGPIVAGTVGGTIGVLLTGALILSVIRRHQKNMKSSQGSRGSGTAGEFYAEQLTISPTSMKSAHTHMRYDANDPRTFPPPIVSELTPSISSGPTHVRPQADVGPGGGAVISFYRGYPQF